MSLPLLKIYLLGVFDNDEQLKYIRIYFWLQFLIPIIDFGYYWSAVRKKVTSLQPHENTLGINLVGVLLACAVLPLGSLYVILFLLATVTAWYNFRLQIARIEGNTQVYYNARLAKVLIDILFIVSLCFFSQLTVEKIIISEIFAVLCVAYSLNNYQLNKQCFFLSLKKGFSFDYLYMILKVFRASLLRLLIPFLFIGEGIEKVLMSVLFYEILAQYLSIEKIKDLLDGKARVCLWLAIYMTSLPLQYFLVYFVGMIMGWEFGTIELICILFGGAARIFSVYTLNVIKHNDFNLLVCLNIGLVVLGLVVLYGVYQFYQGENAALLSLLLFYSLEAVIGLGLVLWVERSKFLRRI